MSKQNKDLLSSFMKKQTNEKSSKKNFTNNTIRSMQKENSDSTQDKDADQNQEEMTEEERLEEAKKTSRNKAAERDQVEMFKKLFVEHALRYIVIVSVMVIFSVGIIKFGPAIFEFLHGFIHGIFLKSLGR